jgi:hypothetical protein
MLDDAIPKNILGMLSLAEDKENALVFYKRWALIVNAKNNYSVFDLLSREEVYSGISLLISAMHIIYHLHNSRACKDQFIYKVDQEYLRCLENIRQYKKKMLTSDFERCLLFSSRLQDSYYRLGEIKTRLSKIY